MFFFVWNQMIVESIEIVWKRYFAIGFDIMERFWNSKKNILNYSRICRYSEMNIPNYASQ